jgi:serine/threonine protein kinase
MLVVDRFGPSLQDRWEAEARSGEAIGPTRLPTKMVLRVGRATLRCLRELHHAGVVHNDVKPANIMLNVPGDPHSVHLIDFGISTRAEWSEGDVCMVDGDALEAEAVGASAGAIATDAANAELLENYCSLPVETIGYSGYLRLQTRAGTPAFASVRQQRGEEPHAREVDDIEALAYTLAYVAAGSLPWQDAPPETAVVWKQRLMTEGWDATFAVSSVADTLSCAGDAPSAKVAEALRALWAQVLACQGPGTSVDYEACLAALE